MPRSSGIHGQVVHRTLGDGLMHDINTYIQLIVWIVVGFAFTYTTLYAHSSKELNKLAAKHKRAAYILDTINSLAKPVVAEMSTLDLSGVEKKNKAKEDIAGYLKLFHVDADRLDPIISSFVESAYKASQAGKSVADSVDKVAPVIDKTVSDVENVLQEVPADPVSIDGKGNTIVGDAPVQNLEAQNPVVTPVETKPIEVKPAVEAAKTVTDVGKGD